jgi:cyclopropane fatty-acyl-phospholipid synthase-like methyltransferase
MRRLQLPSSAPEHQTVWWTLDINDANKPDFIFDLEKLEKKRWFGRTWEVPGGPYDEIHAYDVLEHFGRQGDYRGFFRGFNALHRALVPGGYLIGTVPSWDARWVWGDPGHRRTIQPETVAYLTKEHYKQLGRTRCTDYRKWIKPYWWETAALENNSGSFEFALKAVHAE